MSHRFKAELTLVDDEGGAPHRLRACPSQLVVTLRRSAGAPAPVPRVAPGDAVAAGDRLAEGVHADVLAACPGTVVSVSGTIHVRCAEGAAWELAPHPALAAARTDGFAGFLARAGIVGMGGGKFPASVKFASAHGARTLVVNGVECEPGTTIDAALLRHDAALVRAGAEAVASAVGAQEIVLAAGPAGESAPLEALYPWRILRMPAGYPAGAERLILWKLTGVRLPAGALPARLGVLLHNVATLRAIGRAVRDQVPCVERPLSVLNPALGKRRNVIVPVGMLAADVLRDCGWPVDETSVVVAGGLMMGQRVDPATAAVTRGTTSLTILPASTVSPRERACIRCGACYDACPLDLHPIDLAERVARDRPYPRVTKAQLDECFLCGVCSAVCPANIPIAQRLREARHG